MKPQITRFRTDSHGNLFVEVEQAHYARKLQNGRARLTSITTWKYHGHVSPESDRFKYDLVCGDRGYITLWNYFIRMAKQYGSKTNVKY